MQPLNFLRSILGKKLLVSNSYDPSVEICIAWWGQMGWWMVKCLVPVLLKTLDIARLMMLMIFSSTVLVLWRSIHPIKSTCSTTVLHPPLTWYSVHEDDDRGGGSDVIIVMWDSLPLISPIWDPYITNLPPVQSLYHLLSHRSEQSYYSYLCLARHLSTIYFMYSSIYGWEFVKLTTKAASLFNGSDLNLNWFNIWTLIG